jgi:hypothetical protein
MDGLNQIFSGKISRGILISAVLVNAIGETF